MWPSFSETRKFPNALKAHRGPHPAISGPETVSGLFFLLLIAGISGQLLRSSLHLHVFASSLNDWFAKGDAGFRKVSQAHRWTRRDQDLNLRLRPHLRFSHKDKEWLLFGQINKQK